MRANSSIRRMVNETLSPAYSQWKMDGILVLCTLMMRRVRGFVQIGNLVQAQWRARLSEQLGTYQLELVRNPSAVFLDDALKLAGLSSCKVILDVSLPEREANVSVWQSTTALIDIICLADNLEDWLAFYVKWTSFLISLVLA